MRTGMELEHEQLVKSVNKCELEKKCCILIQENKTWHKVLRTLY